MAMRYGDTTKWDGGWYRWLKPKMKCAWDFMTDKCEGVGTLRFDLKDISSKVCEEITVEEFKETFEGRVFWLADDKIWIPGSFPFRNKRPSTKNRIQRLQIEKWLGLSNIFSIGDALKNTQKEYIELLARGSGEAQASVARASIVHSTLNIEHRTLKGGVGEKVFSPVAQTSSVFKFDNRSKFDLPELFNCYPRVQKKTQSLDMLSTLVIDQKIYDELKTAIKRYSDHCSKEGTEAAYILTFPSFLAEWRDWLDPKVGTSKLRDASKPRPIAEILADKNRGSA